VWGISHERRRFKRFRGFIRFKRFNRCRGFKRFKTRAGQPLEPLELAQVPGSH